MINIPAVADQILTHLRRTLITAAKTGEAKIVAPRRVIFAIFTISKSDVDEGNVETSSNKLVMLGFLARLNTSVVIYGGVTSTVFLGVERDHP